MVHLNKDEKIIEFVSFCIESYKVKYNMKGKDVANLFSESGVIDFLMESYDLLHTQGEKYILSEIQLFLENRGYFYEFAKDNTGKCVYFYSFKSSKSCRKVI